MSLASLLGKQFGVKTSYNINPLVTTVGTAVTKVLSYNPMRLGCLIINLSGNLINIAPDNLVSSTRGILLGSNGGTYTLLFNEDFELTASEWYAVATGAASSIFIIEVIDLTSG